MPTRPYQIWMLFSIGMFIAGIFMLAVLIVQLTNLIGFYLVFDLGFYAIGSVLLVWLLIPLAFKIMRGLRVAFRHSELPIKE